MIGTLNINKPTGITSRSAVNHVQRIARQAKMGRMKMGHAGTLDPLASGVLVLCVGAATRLMGFVQKMPKRYRATFLLGHESDTEDIAGRVIPITNPPRPGRADIEAVLPRLVGTIWQRPPIYSALKLHGRRACDRARQGEIVELKPREVEIHKLVIVEYEYPTLILDIECGKGTYVRSLGRDVAKLLGTAAVMSSLERTAIGCFKVEDACILDQLTSTNLSSHMLPAATAVSTLPLIIVSENEAERIASGQSIDQRCDVLGEQVAAFDRAGELRAILVRRKDGWGPTCNLFPALS